MAKTTIRRNWKKKIQAICADVKEMIVYSLDNVCDGDRASIPEDDQTNPEQYLENLVNTELGASSDVKFSFDKETGEALLFINEDHWYTFTNKIEW